MNKNSCRTYFRISGNADPCEILRELELTPSKVTVKDGSTEIDVGYNDTYSTDINDMLRVTLSELFGKEEQLLELKSTLGLDYYLVTVPELAKDSDEPHPILSLDSDIIEFLYRSKTVHDLDYYIY
jgi:hypothetical protein